MKVYKYIESLILFFIKGKVIIDANFIKIENPNTILKVIPFGAKKESIPINHLASVNDNFRLNFKAFLSGIFLLIIGFSAMNSGNSTFLGFILLILGISNIINSFETTLSILTTNGTSYQLEFIIFEKKTAFSIKNDLELFINSRLDDTNIRIQKQSTDEILKQILNK